MLDPTATSPRWVDRGALTTDLGGRAVSRSLVYSRSSFSISIRRRSVKERSRAASRDMVVDVEDRWVL
jgi:hypothetical protein